MFKGYIHIKTYDFMHHIYGIIMSQISRLIEVVLSHIVNNQANDL